METDSLDSDGGVVVDGDDDENRLLQLERDFNETSRDLLSSTTEAVGVDLYPVVSWFAALLTLLTVGLVGNVALLLAAVATASHRGRGSGCCAPPRSSRRYPAAGGVSSATPQPATSSGRRWSFSPSCALSINQSVIGLFACLLVAPLQFAAVAENYVKRPLPEVACWTTVAGYQLAVGAMVTCLALQAVSQFRRLSVGRAVGSAEGQTASARRPGFRASCRLATIMDIGLPWLVGLTAAALTSLELPILFDHRICLESVAYRPLMATTSSSHAENDTWRLRAALVVVYVIALAASGLVLSSRYFLQRKKLATMLLGAGGSASDAGRRLLDDGPDAEGEPNVSGQHGKQGSKTKRTSSNKSTGSRSSTRKQQSLLSRKEQRQSIDSSPDVDEASVKDNEAQHDVEEDDDTFDMKMRLKFQKKARSSGRRHTVANIGLPDLVGRLRRGSLSDTGLTAGTHRTSGLAGRRGASGSTGGGSGATTPEYHYVRKWSVDIIALADQLENPKAALMVGATRAGSCQFNELPGSLRASPSPPGGPGGRPVRPGRSSSPLAPRLALPSIVAENETAEQETTNAGTADESGANTGEKSSGKTLTEDMAVEQKPPCVVDSPSSAGVVQNQSETSENVSASAGKQPESDAAADKETSENENATETAASVASSTPVPVGVVTSSLATTTKPENRARQSFAMAVAASDMLENISSLPLDPPSIVVSSLNDDDRRSATVNSDDDFGSTNAPDGGCGSGVWNALRSSSDDRRSTGLHSPRGGAGRKPASGRGPATTINDRSAARMRRQLERCRRLCLGLAVSFALVVPYATLIVWNSSLVMSAARPVDSGYNMSLAAAALLAVLFVISGPMIVWVDRRLLARLAELWAKLSRLRCVCYCNLGRGKNCFHPTTTTTTTTSTANSKFRHESACRFAVQS